MAWALGPPLTGAGVDCLDAQTVSRREEQLCGSGAHGLPETTGDERTLVRLAPTQGTAPHHLISIPFSFLT